MNQIKFTFLAEMKLLIVVIFLVKYAVRKQKALDTFFYLVLYTYMKEGFLWVGDFVNHSKYSLVFV